MFQTSRRTRIGLGLLAGLIAAGSLWLRRLLRPPVDPEIAGLVHRYFKSWSRRDMDGYRDCFHPTATVHYLRDGKSLSAWSLDRFIEVQRQALEQAPWREIPLAIRVDGDGPISRAVVGWRLYKRDRATAEGVDYFTLANTPGGWKIVHLVFRSIRRL